MEELRMSAKERVRLDALHRVERDEITVVAAAGLMGVPEDTEPLGKVGCQEWLGGVLKAYLSKGSGRSGAFVGAGHYEPSLANLAKATTGERE